MTISSNDHNNQKGSHEYDFNCHCWYCEDITCTFNIKSKEQAEKLGYQLTSRRES